MGGSSIPAEGVTAYWAGDRYLRLGFGNLADDATLARVHAAHRRLRGAGIEGVDDVTPAYTTLLVTLDIRACNEAIMRRIVAAIGDKQELADSAIERVVEMPVCFGGVHGEDLVGLAGTHGLTVEDVVQMYGAAEYRVAFVGFTPGFAYIRGLPERLATPRLASPRARVPAGSVGIAGRQTGVYPGGTPGGWRLIGRTPLRVFDASREPAALLAAGNRVRFVPISEAEFQQLNEHTDRAEGRP